MNNVKTNLTWKLQLIQHRANLSNVQLLEENGTPTEKWGKGYEQTLPRKIHETLIKHMEDIQPPS